MYITKLGLNKHIKVSDLTAADTNTLSQSKSRSNGNEGMIPHSPDLQNWSFTTGFILISYPGCSFCGGFYPSAGDTVNIF